jgi:hypothetical protein
MADEHSVVCNFRTGVVELSAATFAMPAEAVTHVDSLLRALQRFARAYDDGVRSEQSYRIWSAAEQAPVRMIIPGSHV